jgi:hypothetical protein
MSLFSARRILRFMGFAHRFEEISRSMHPADCNGCRGSSDRRLLPKVRSGHVSRPDDFHPEPPWQFAWQFAAEVPSPLASFVAPVW